MYVASIFGYFEYIEINAFITGSMAIGIISGAYSTEVFRGAIQSIDKGKFEAAKVLGVGKFAQFYKIIHPPNLFYRMREVPYRLATIYYSRHIWN